MLAGVGLIALLPLPAYASLGSNLNYDSPSRRHPNLGIDVLAVSRRSFKRDAIAYQPSELNFTHGVASSDPYSDSVIIWTRIAPSLSSSDSNVIVEGSVPLYNHDTESYIKVDANPICVDWTISRAVAISTGNSTGNSIGNSTGNSSSPISTGKAYTTGDIDYTIKVRTPSPTVTIQTWHDWRLAGWSDWAAAIHHLQLSIHCVRVRQH